jgi:adenylate kinase
VLLGPPNSGKGTQAKALAERLGVPAISTGEMLRGSVAEGSELGRRVDSIMKAGRLVDDETMAEVVRERLVQADAAGGFLLDGYPRTPAQAGTLDEILAERGEDLDGVISLRVPEETLLARASQRGRVDDGAEVMRERLQVYGEQTRPLVEHYRGRGLLYEVDGNRPVPVVTDAIVAALGGLPGKSQGRAVGNP